MNAKLLVVQGRPKGKSLHFPPGEYYFGRGAECHVRPNSDWVSRQHCLLKVGPQGSLSVSDLGSRNGTLVNGVRILAETALKPGDQLQVGQLVFEVAEDDGHGQNKTVPEGAHNETAEAPPDSSTHLPESDELGSPPLTTAEDTRSNLLLPKAAES